MSQSPVGKKQKYEKRHKENTWVNLWEMTSFLTYTNIFVHSFSLPHLLRKSLFTLGLVVFWIRLWNRLFRKVSLTDDFVHSFCPVVDVTLKAADALKRIFTVNDRKSFLSVSRPERKITAADPVPARVP